VKVLPGFYHVNPVFLSGKSWLEINTWEGRSTAVKSLMIKNYPVIIIKPWLSFIYFLPPLKYFSGFWKLFLTADNNWSYQFVLYKSLAMYN
jgi:hypothetical protein